SAAQATFDSIEADVLAHHRLVALRPHDFHRERHAGLIQQAAAVMGCDQRLDFPAHGGVTVANAVQINLSLFGVAAHRRVKDLFNMGEISLGHPASRATTRLWQMTSRALRSPLIPSGPQLLLRR